MKVKNIEELNSTVRDDGLIMTDIFKHKDLGVQIGMAVFPPHAQVIPATHEEHEYSYIIEGSIKVTAENGQFRVSKGMMCNIAAGELHGVVNDNDNECRLIWVFIDDK